MVTQKVYTFSFSLQNAQEVDTFRSIIDKAVKTQKKIGFEEKTFTKEEFYLLTQIQKEIK